MKIIIIGPANPYRGGIAALNERLAIQLINEGHEVEIVSFTVQYPTFLFPGKTQFTDTPPPTGIKITRMINSVNPLNWLLTGITLRKRKPDLVIVRFWLPFMSPSTGTICKLIRGNRKTKVIAIVDNLIPHEKRIGDKILIKYFLNQTDGLLAMSDCVYNDFSLFCKTKPKKLSPHPIYDHYGEIISMREALIKLNLDPSKKYILFFGFIRDYKGLDLLLEAFADKRIDKNKYRLIVAGEFYSNEEKYRKMITDLSLQNEVVLYDEYIPENEVNKFFCASSIIAQPYKSATQSGVTQIGYHFNKPMLVTNVGGLSEIIENGKCGYVVDPIANEITEALLDYFENGREEYFTDEVKKAKERFSWTYYSKAILELCALCS
jgi:glycosyltransferase involved in cell wall biosynthesis